MEHSLKARVAGYPLSRNLSAMRFIYSPTSHPPVPCRGDVKISPAPRSAAGARPAARHPGLCRSPIDIIRRYLGALLLAISIGGPAPIAARAQDVPGIEVCTRENGLDRRTSCMQSNVEFLQQLIIRNALDAQQKLTAANREIAALRESLAGTGREIMALREQLAGSARDLAMLRESIAAGQAKINELQRTPQSRPQSR